MFSCVVFAQEFGKSTASKVVRFLFNAQLKEWLTFPVQNHSGVPRNSYRNLLFFAQRSRFYRAILEWKFDRALLRKWSELCSWPKYATNLPRTTAEFREVVTLEQWFERNSKTFVFFIFLQFIPRTKYESETHSSPRTNTYLFSLSLKLLYVIIY